MCHHKARFLLCVLILSIITFQSFGSFAFIYLLLLFIYLAALDFGSRTHSAFCWWTKIIGPNAFQENGQTNHSNGAVICPFHQLRPSWFSGAFVLSVWVWMKFASRRGRFAWNKWPFYLRFSAHIEVVQEARMILSKIKKLSNTSDVWCWFCPGTGYALGNVTGFSSQGGSWNRRPWIMLEKYLMDAYQRTCSVSAVFRTQPLSLLE